MKIKLLLLTTLSLILFSCDNDDEIPVSANEYNLYFDIEVINQNNEQEEEYKSSTQNIVKVEEKKSSYQLNNNNTVSLFRNLSLIVKLKNQKEVNFNIYLTKREVDKNLVTLDKNGKNWDFKNYEDKVNLFYKNYSKAYISVAHKSIIYRNGNRDLEIINIKKKIIDGKEKCHLTLRFNGNFYGDFDPEKLYTYNKITNSLFSGIIE